MQRQIRPTGRRRFSSRPSARHWSPCCKAGFTLLEMTVAFGLAGLVSLVVVATTMYAARCFQAMGNYADLNRSSRQALDTMTRDIRQAKVLTSFATNQLIFTDLTNGTFSYTWDATAGTVTRVYNGNSQVLLTHCDTLAFHMSQRNPSNNFTFWPATVATNAKLIDVSWDCSRPLFGKKANTETIQTAKIAIRN